MDRVEKIKVAVAASLQLAGLVGVLAIDSTVVDAIGVAIMAWGGVILAFVEPSKPQP